LPQTEAIQTSGIKPAGLVILVEGGRKDAIIMPIQTRPHVHHIPEIDRIEVGPEVLHHQIQEIPLLRLQVLDKSGGLSKHNVNLRSRYRRSKSHSLAMRKKRHPRVLKQAMKAKYPT
jgi:hypothetical protein